MLVITNKSDTNLSIKLESTGFLIIPYQRSCDIEFLTPTDIITLKKLSRDYLVISTNSVKDLKKYSDLDIKYRP